MVGMLLSLCREEGSHGDRDQNIALFDACRKTVVSVWNDEPPSRTLLVTGSLKNQYASFVERLDISRLTI